MENFQKMEHKYPIMFMIPNYQKKKKKKKLHWDSISPPKRAIITEKKTKNNCWLGWGETELLYIASGKEINPSTNEILIEIYLKN